MCGRKAIFANTTFWKYDAQIGAHHLAREYVRQGWEVAFLGGPVSPLHWMKPGVPQKKERFSMVRQGKWDLDGRLWSYVPFTLTPPYYRGPLARRWVLKNWIKLTLQSVKRGDSNGQWLTHTHIIMHIIFVILYI